MKKILSICVFFLLLGVTKVSAQQDSDNLWVEANKFYEDGNYANAIESYNKIVETGYISEELYYNLANAYFKSDSLSKAIANYRRALNLDPTDEDIIYNLEVARAKTVNKIDEVPTFFLHKWLNHFSAVFPSNAWASISLVSFAIMLIFLAAYLLSNTAVKRKAMFTVSVFGLVFFIVSLANAVTSKNNIVDSKEAVVTSSAISVKSSPNNNGKDLFILNEGVEVETLDEMNGYTEIKLVNGNKGWIKSSAIELI
ncbi:MAG: tetratricopeptide repeat protein [Rikenellaceae bacterium]